MADASQNTVIAGDTRIKGEMTFKGTARIDGKFEGNIEAQGELQVGNSASCAADINADSLVCDGIVTGNVTAVQRVQLNGKAKMKGDIVSERLICAEGASLVGHVTVGPDARKGTAGQPADSKAPPPKK